jgi:hypothetical protein
MTRRSCAKATRHMAEPNVQKYEHPPITEAVIEYEKRFSFDEQENGQIIRLSPQSVPMVGQTASSN